MRIPIFIVFLSFSFPFAEAEDLTERQVLEKLVSESPRAKALAAQVELAHATARAEGLPPNGSLSFTREAAADSPETFLLYEQPLPITGRRGYERKAALARAESEGMSVEMQLHELRVNARMAFLDLLLAQEQMAVFDSERTRLQEMVDILKKREEAGESSGYDVIRAERELSILEADRGDAEAGLDRAGGRLAALLNVSADSGLYAVGALELPALPDTVSLMERSSLRGDIRAEQRLVESSKLSMEAARRKRYPEPVVAAGMKTPVILDERYYGYVVSVTIPLPFFDRGKEEAARAASARRAAEARAQAIRTEVQLRIKAASEETQTRIRAAELYHKRAVAETGDLVRIATAAYEEDEVGILELIDAYRTQREVRLRLQELTAAAKQSALELERLVGEEVIP